MKINRDSPVTMPLSLMIAAVVGIWVGASKAFTIDASVNKLKADMFLVKRTLHIKDSDTVNPGVFFENAEGSPPEGRTHEEAAKKSPSNPRF